RRSLVDPSTDLFMHKNNTRSRCIKHRGPPSSAKADPPNPRRLSRRTRRTLDFTHDELRRAVDRGLFTAAGLMGAFRRSHDPRAGGRFGRLFVARGGGGPPLIGGPHDARSQPAPEGVASVTASAWACTSGRRLAKASRPESRSGAAIQAGPLLPQLRRDD